MGVIKLTVTITKLLTICLIVFLLILKFVFSSATDYLMLFYHPLPVIRALFTGDRAFWAVLH